MSARLQCVSCSATGRRSVNDIANQEYKGDPGLRMALAAHGQEEVTIITIPEGRRDPCGKVQSP
jgi:hypothetical protein